MAKKWVKNEHWALEFLSSLDFFVISDSTLRIKLRKKDWQTNRQKTERRKDGKTERQKDKKTDRHKDREDIQTDRQTDGQTDRQTERHIYIHTDR